MSLLLSLFEYKAWADAELFDALAQVDAEAHAQPRHLALRLLNHIHVVDQIFAAHLRGQPHGFTATNTEATPTLEALRAAALAVDADYVALVRELTPEQLDEPLAFRFTDGDGGRMSRAEMLGHVITHGNYHRGGVGMLLRQSGVTPPRDGLTGFLHQREPGRRQGGV